MQLCAQRSLQLWGSSSGKKAGALGLVRRSPSITCVVLRNTDTFPYTSLIPLNKMMGLPKLAGCKLPFEGDY